MTEYDSGRTWKEAILDHSKELSQDLERQTEQNYENLRITDLSEIWNDPEHEA
jgi:hypothetical protein